MENIGNLAVSFIKILEARIGVGISEEKAERICGIPPHFSFYTLNIHLTGILQIKRRTGEGIGL